MNAVTTDTRRHAFFSRLEQLPVHTGVILAFLIDPQAWIESLHEIRVAVALSAVRGDIELLWLSQITFPRIFCTFLAVVVGISAMTIITRQSSRTMDVIGEKFGRRAESRIVQPSMALNARALFLRLSDREERQYRN